MLMPKRTKYRRVQRGRLKGKAMRGNRVTNGEFGLVALEPAWITSNQIEAARIAMTPVSYTHLFGTSSPNKFCLFCARKSVVHISQKLIMKIRKISTP